MTHARQAIRQQVVTMLTAQAGSPPAYQTDAGANVFPTRVLPWKAHQLPALGVYTLDETVDPESRFTAPRVYRRTLQLAVEARVRQTANMDNEVDSLCAQVEAVLAADPYLAGNVADCILSSTEITVSAEGDEPVGMALMTFTVLYDTYAPEPGAVSADKFQTADIEQSANGQITPTEDQVTGLDP